MAPTDGRQGHRRQRFDSRRSTLSIRGDFLPSGAGIAVTVMTRNPLPLDFHILTIKMKTIDAVV
jgi:hypothetical protein